VLRKEYGSRLGGRRWAASGSAAEHSGASALSSVEFASIIAIWIALAVAYLIVRTLKLSGKLGTT
jgi:hypothetical protein